MRRLEQGLVVVQASTGTPSSSNSNSNSNSNNNNNDNYNDGMYDSHKNLDRAHVEETLDHAMGDDWRLFRAKLVAQELREQEEVQHTERQQGSKFFSLPRRVVSKLVSKVKKLVSKTKFDPTHRAPRAVSEDPFVSTEELPIFIPPSPKIDEHFWVHPMSHVEVGSILISTDKVRSASPFHKTVILILKHSDLPDEPTVGLILNKSLHKTLLQVPNPRNERRRDYTSDSASEDHPPSYYTQQEEDEGGNMTPDPFSGPMQSPQEDYHSSEKTTNLDRTTQVAFWYAPVYYGGPEDSEQYTTMHGFGHVEGSKRIVPGVYCGGSRAFLEGGLTPPLLFVKGHTIWNKRHLQRQIRKKQWVICSASPEWLLRGTSSIPDSYYSKIAMSGSNSSKIDSGCDNLWADLLTSLGGKYAKMVKDRKQTSSSSSQTHLP